MYLSYAVPWMRPGQEAASQTLALVVAAQKTLVDRLHDMILENNGAVDFGRFPFAFTSLHDLSFDYLLHKTIGHQEQMVGEIEVCVEALRMAPLAQALAQEAWGEAKGHLESLREAAQSLAPAGAAPVR